MCPPGCHGVGGEAELQVGAEVLCVPELSCPAPRLWQPHPSCPGDESGHGRRPGARTGDNGGISAPPACPGCARRERNPPDCRKARGHPKICPLSSAFRCALPASPPGTARTCSAKDREAGNSRRRISHRLGATVPTAGRAMLLHRHRAPSLGQVTGGELCPSALSHPAKTLGRGHGESPGLAAPFVLPQGWGLAVPR